MKDGWVIDGRSQEVLLNEFEQPLVIKCPGAFHMLTKRLSVLLHPSYINNLWCAIRVLTLIEANAQMMKQNKDGEKLLNTVKNKLREWERSTDGYERMLSLLFIRLREGMY